MAASSLILKRVYHSSFFFKILNPAARFISPIPPGGAVHRRPFHSSAAFNNDHRPPAFRTSADNSQKSKNEVGYRVTFSREPVFSSKINGEIETRDDSENHYMIFDMPGFTKQDINAWLEENVLTIKGVINEKEFEEEEEEDRKNVFHVVLFMNPSLHQLDDMKIEVTNGILYIVLPKLPGIKHFQE